MDGTVTLAASGTAEVSVASFVSVAGGFSLTESGTLLVATLTGASAFVGIGGSVSGFVVTPGSLGFWATVGEVDVALQSGHYGVDVKDASGSLVGVPAITFDVEHLDATVNPDAIDWHSLDSSLTMDGSVTLAASGTAEVSAAGFVALAGSFSFTENGTLLRVTLTNASAFVGIGGSVSGFVVVPGSVGISATAGTVDVALQAGHYGVEVKNLAGQLVGVPGLTFQVSGVDAVANPEGIDWHALDSTLTMDGSTRIGASGSVALSAFGFVWAAGAFTLSDATITAGSLLAMTLSHVSALVGIGGGFSGISGTDVSAATVDTSNAIGVFATADEVDVATLVVSPTVTHLGVEVKNLTGGLTGDRRRDHHRQRARRSGRPRRVRLASALHHRRRTRTELHDGRHQDRSRVRNAHRRLRRLPHRQLGLRHLEVDRRRRRRRASPAPTCSSSRSRRRRSRSVSARSGSRSAAPAPPSRSRRSRPRRPTDAAGRRCSRATSAARSRSARSSRRR